MRKINYNKLSENILFKDIPSDQIINLVINLNTKVVIYESGSYIFHSGEILKDIGIIYSGNILLCKSDIEGNLNIINRFSESDNFAEVLVINQKPLPYELVAESEVIVIYINYQRLTELTDNPYQSILIRNLLSALAEKVDNFSQRIQVLSERKTRDKLLTYLHQQEIVDDELTIPYNREQLANYLCVDRSALSSVLMKLKKEKVLIYNKNSFKFLK